MNTINTERAAYAEAANRAYRNVAEYGQVTGGAMLRGQLEALILANAAVHGWEATFDLIRQCARGKYVPANGHKLALAVSNTAEIVHSRVPKAS